MATKKSGNGGDRGNPPQDQSLERRSSFQMERQTNELAPTQAMAEAQFDIQSAIMIARRFPRNEVEAERKLLKSAERPVFADESSYSYPRGWKKDEKGNQVRNYIEGPSVVLAREAARFWGNIRYGVEVTFDDEEDRKIRAYAYDMETNVRVTAEDSFKKLVQRKVYEDGHESGTQWIVADERELRELTNRRGAILVRNCILQIIPSDIIDNVRNACEVTLTKQAEANKDQTIGRLVKAFEGINISLKMIETKLGHSLKDAKPEELTELRKVFASIRDGNSSWSEYTAPKNAPPDPGNDKAPGTGTSGSLDVSGMTSGGSTEKDKEKVKKDSRNSQGSGKGGRTSGDSPATSEAPSSGKKEESGNPSYSDHEPEPDPGEAGTGDLFNREPGEEG